MLNFVLGVILHNLSTRNRLVSLPQAHKGKVSGLCFADGDRLLSCGVDRNIKLWSITSGSSTTVRTQFPIIFSDIQLSRSDSPSMFSRENQHSSMNYSNVSRTSSYLFDSSIDHHRTDSLFATASNLVQIWDETKSVISLVYLPEYS